MNIQKVGVIGCGLMGAGIAQVAAQAGYTTVVRELNEEYLEKGLGHISTFLDKGVAKNKMSPAVRDSTWASIQGTTDMADLSDCDLVIEVIFEDIETKKSLFKELDGICKEDTIFASNTSSLSIAEMATATNRPDKVAGLHYFFPSAINQLLEVVAAEQTSSEVVDALMIFARATGKVPILVKDAPGFAVNRFFVPWLNEAARILDEGKANVPTIDEAAREAFKIGMGPFALMNATGIPIAYHSTSSLAQSLGDFHTPADYLTSLYESKKQWDLDGDIDDSAKAEIGERLMGVVFGVAVQLVEEGVATKGDTNCGALVGLRWAKGPFEMMNKMGIDQALKLVGQVATHHDSFDLPQLLKQQAINNQPWALPDVKLEVNGHIATIMMSRPQAMNALNEKVLNELKGAIAQVGNDPEVRVVIISGEGPAFVAGADIRAMLAKDINEIREFTQFGQGVMNDIDELGKPVIAAINGFALGGGLELALACDIRVASTDASMGLPEVGLGIYPGFGGTQRATRLLGKGRACELIFTGEQIGAEEALRIGLVNRVFPAQQLMTETRHMANRIAHQGPVAVSTAKMAVNQALQTSLEAGLVFELDGVIETFKTKDQKEGMTAFLERRNPEFTGE